MRRRNKWQQSNDYLKPMILPAVIFLALLAFLAAGLTSAGGAASREGLKVLENSVFRATVQCYAIEGMYPPDVAYLEDNYGVLVDHDRYIVHYEAFAANILPDITILRITPPGGALDE